MYGLTDITKLNAANTKAEEIVAREESRVDWDALRKQDAEFFQRVAEKRQAREAGQGQCAES